MTWRTTVPDTAGWDKAKTYFFWVKPYGKTKPAQIAMVAWGGRVWLSDAILTFEGRLQDLGRLAGLTIWWWGPIDAPEGP